MGRSESSSDFGGALLAVVVPLAEVELPPAVELDSLPSCEAVSEEPGRRSTGGPLSSLSTSWLLGLALGCFAACAASRASKGCIAFHWPSAIQFPLTSLGVVTVNHPAGSP